MGKHSAGSAANAIPTQRDEAIQQYQAEHNGALPPEMAQPSTPIAINQPAPTTQPEQPSTQDKVPLFGRKQEILRLRTELARMTADNNRLWQENHDMTVRIQQLGGMSIAERDELIRQLDTQIAQRQAMSSTIDDQLTDSRQELDKIRSRVLDLRNSEDLQEVGLYDYENPAEDSVALQTRLATNRQQQKEMVRDKTAVHTTRGFTFNNSTSKGNKFLKDMAQMALSLYNAEAENCVKSVKAGNLETSIKRLNRCSDRIARFGKFIELRISVGYQRLRIEELELTARHMQAVKAEKDAERERRAELREQQKAQKELEAEMARLRKEQEHYQNVLAKMKEKGDLEEAAKLEAKLDDIDKSINDVDYRAANILAGYVYVISDVGAFGERMVKIGMTRRLDPMDRVRELSSAAVPFKFDVHALFFSEDAVSLETMLHHEFEDRRVNKVNARKEFYYCTPQEVLDKLREKDVAVVEYRVEPEAEEYRISRSIEEQRRQAQR
ncbi:DUF4041 domain-containing protein [Bifidobacterium callimiconis]|uniref:Bacteriophage T5 Orf172 DNA-binding domain-containing protein n=1 Tax=Bifidobacterium callimiconis TaxID=2306973 RepID=A0A430FIG0_9BIFI|nr:DUF4041 domain-containing protein [Bifidobacterium callimiconis]RSX52684.1 hypothetical protein D2E23_0412 [Bifidobacterium callimiconis]